MEPSQLPEHVSVALDPALRIDAVTRTLVGGVPLRLLRVSDRGLAVVEALRAGAAPVRTPAVDRLLRQLTDASMADPVPSEVVAADVAVVVPVFDGAEPLDEGLPAGTVIVHDGGPNAAALRARCLSAGWDLRRLDENAGPAAARTAGRDSVDASVVVFVDADVTIPEDSFQRLCAHFADPAVAAVAPRVRSAPGTNLRARFERFRSPLDLGDRPALVRPDGRVSHVPTAMLAVRSEAFDAIGGFDAALRFGEDVDLVWRLHEAGWRVRHAPEVEVEHRPRSSWGRLFRQRFGYGSAAAPLDRRHPGAAAPVRLNAWSAAAWGLLTLGRGRVRLAGLVVAAASTVGLARQLDGAVSDPMATAVRLGGRGTLLSGRWLAHAAMRAWAPILVPLSIAGRRTGPLAAAAIVPAGLEWMEKRPDIDPVRWVVLRTAEDLAYCAGVWRGMATERSMGAIRPRFTGVPGLRSGKRSASAGGPVRS